MRRWSFCLLALTLMLAGCMPTACNRQESRALLPSDSLSRAVAAEVPMDTLTVVWTSTGPAEAPLVFPRTVQFGPGPRLYVADPEQQAVVPFSLDGIPASPLLAGVFEVPFLAGHRGDTLVVFDPTARTLALVAEGTVARRVSTPDDVPERGSLQYAAAAPSGFFFKTLGEEADGYLARLDASGAVTDRTTLPGPHWRHAGLLRALGDTLLSLSGFRPVIDVWAPGEPLDTLALVGFDSPMLARSRLFVLGENHQPPLLTESSVVAGERLFVLNLRPGWVQIDVYGLDGRLRHRLIQRDPQVRRNFYPRDLAVRPRAAGGYDLAVALAEPEPSVVLYRWMPPGGAPTAAAGRPSVR